MNIAEFERERRDRHGRTVGPGQLRNGAGVTGMELRLRGEQFAVGAFERRPVNMWIEAESCSRA